VRIVTSNVNSLRTRLPRVLAPLATAPVELGRGLSGEPDPLDARWVEADDHAPLVADLA
jgi:hypothetical protein